MHHVSSRQRATRHLQPVIAEILRTCVYPPTINLRVERVTHKRIEYRDGSGTETRHGYASKLLLTDGELLVQALLHRKLSTLSEIQDLDPGDVVEIHKFTIKKAQRTSGEGHVVYLGIDNCYVIRSERQDEKVIINESARAVKPALEDNRESIDPLAGGFFPEDIVTGQSEIEKEIHSAFRRVIVGEAENTHQNKELSILEGLDSKVQAQGGSTDRRFSPRTPKRKVASLYESESDREVDAFETVKINLSTAKKRRQALHSLSQNVTSSPSRPPTRDLYQSKPKQHEGDENLRRTTTVRFETDENLGLQGGINVVADKSPALSEDNVVLFKRQNSTSLTQILNGPAPSISRPTTPIASVSQVDSHGPYHTLSSLYSALLPSKSYVFTTLAIPTYVSSHLIARPNSPFPPKRHIKVMDPSLASRFAASNTGLLGKGITVSVYRDATNFKPPIGKVALMRGVVMQRISGAMRNGNQSGQGEVILNIYPIKSRIQRQSQTSDQRYHRAAHQTSAQTDGSHVQIGGHDIATNQPALTTGSRTNFESERRMIQNRYEMTSIPREVAIEDLTEGCWFINDHDFLRGQGYDVDIMQRWWDERNITKQSHQTSEAE